MESGNPLVRDGSRSPFRVLVSILAKTVFAGSTGIYFQIFRGKASDILFVIYFKIFSGILSGNLEIAAEIYLEIPPPNHGTFFLE